MTTKEERRPALSMADAEELPTYRQVSRWAMAAMLGGLCAPLALVHPVFWVLPVIVLVVALVGWRRTAARDSEYSGRLLAVGGLILAAVFGGWAPARHFFRKATIERQAKEFAFHWFETVEAQQLKELHQLSRSPSQRRPLGVSLDDAYNVKAEEHGVTGEQAMMMSLEMDPRVQLDKFVEEFPLSELLAHARDGALLLDWNNPPPPPPGKPYSRIAFDRVQRNRRMSALIDEVSLVFTWQSSDGEAVRSRPLTLNLERERSTTGPFVTWRERAVIADK